MKFLFFIRKFPIILGPRFLLHKYLFAPPNHSVQSGPNRIFANFLSRRHRGWIFFALIHGFCYNMSMQVLTDVYPSNFYSVHVWASAPGFGALPNDCPPSPRPQLSVVPKVGNNKWRACPISSSKRSMCLSWLRQESHVSVLRQSNFSFGSRLLTELGVLNKTVWHTTSARLFLLPNGYVQSSNPSSWSRIRVCCVNQLRVARVISNKGGQY